MNLCLIGNVNMNPISSANHHGLNLTITRSLGHRDGLLRLCPWRTIRELCGKMRFVVYGGITEHARLQRE
jgi:hypothetical protein